MTSVSLFNSMPSLTAARYAGATAAKGSALWAFSSRRKAKSRSDSAFVEAVKVEPKRYTACIPESFVIDSLRIIEVQMGMPLRDIIFKIGGGVLNGKKFKAVQTGGPSGGVLPESRLDIPVDFDELRRAGSMMGSGGMIVMDEETCMVDTARFYIEFLAHESCGKCVPCREGLRQMLHILNDITSGKGREGDIELLQELSEVIQEASMCALGQSAPNPVMSTIKHFRDEYETHIKEKRCPAGVCKELIMYQIDQEKCKGCGLCMKNCPGEAITKIGKKRFTIDETKCIKCGVCFTVCPEKFSAVVKIPDNSFSPAIAA